MASTHKSLRSSTADKRPTTSIADGQIALNTNAASPGLFFKDSAGTGIIKVGPVHVGTTAPNATPAAGGSSGNSTGEVWLDTSLTPLGVKIWDGSSWQNATPAGSTTVQGLLELATNAETQTGTDTARAVTPAGLQSKVSDSTSTTSSTTIASSTAVKSAYDLANAALPKTGGVVTGALEIGTTGSLLFEGATANDFETTVAVVDPTADRTVTIPDQNGNFLISGNASIVNADVNASAAIAGTKISPNFGSQTVQTTGVVSHALGTAGAPTITFTGDTNTGVYSPGSDQVAISTAGTGRLFIDSSGRVGIGTTSPGAKLDINGHTYIDSGYIRFLDNATSPTGTAMWRPASDTLAFNTQSTERARIDSSGRLGVGTSSPGAALDVRAGANNTAIEEIAVFARPDAAVRATIEKGLSTGNGISFGTTTGQPIALRTNNTERLYIDNTGNVGIGTSSPSDYNSAFRNLVVANTSGFCGITVASATNSEGTLAFADGTTGSQTYRGYFQYNHTGDYLRIGVNGGEVARFDSSGRLLVNTSSARTNFFNSAETAKIQLEGTSGEALMSLVSNNNASSGNAALILGKTRGTAVGATTIVQNNDNLGRVSFQGSDGTEFVQAADIYAEVDGTPGANNMPGRLVFSTTVDGGSSPSERARISSSGFFKASNTGSYDAATSPYHELTTNQVNQFCVYSRATHASYGSNMHGINAIRAASSVFSYLKTYSGNLSDVEHYLRGDGNAYADGSWNGGGADYAEYFEWSDGNTAAEDRRGISVVLDGDKIRVAVAGEEPIGVISGNPSVVGDADIDRWKGKYLRDDFGTYIQEDYEVEDEDGNTVTQQRRKLNPDYNPDQEYISREDRPEWDCVGLMGKLRIRKGQVTGSRWIKMRDISDSVEEWLVR